MRRESGHLLDPQEKDDDKQVPNDGYECSERHY